MSLNNIQCQHYLATIAVTSFHACSPILKAKWKLHEWLLYFMKIIADGLENTDVFTDARSAISEIMCFCKQVSINCLPNISVRTLWQAYMWPTFSWRDLQMACICCATYHKLLFKSHPTLVTGIVNSKLHNSTVWFLSINCWYSVYLFLWGMFYHSSIILFPIVNYCLQKHFQSMTFIQCVSLCTQT